MQKKYPIPVIFLSCLLAWQAVAAAEPEQPVIREELRLLTRDYADFRKNQVSNVHYTLSVAVAADSDIFNGTARIGFDLAPGNFSPLTIDFDEGEIVSLTVNGNTADWAYEHWFITVAQESLDTGSNEIVIEYRRPFTTDGDGLHKFTDPENGEIYLYTNFEPYNANRLFPHFDQPNLKAPFTLDVLAPANWQLVSNMREDTVTREEDRNHWQFPATPPISSYLYALHAGPFTMWEEQAGNILMRLFARSALAQYVSTDEWFIPTRQFLAFFQDYYAVPYPLNKYDQIVVPDFNAGAMENFGAVTFNERYISRGEKSIIERSRLAYVIAHEMAHMWFGDLVTMNWWNDLWLNESFATYMGYLALNEASEFNDAWDIFYSNGKANAYRADARVTTHPVAPDDVDTTAEAFASFDTITYQKGSSVLKQLPYFIGEENFRRGVSNYLKEHSYDNATLDDFVNALADSAGMDLDNWKVEWLQKSGANTLRAEFSCDNGQVSAMRLVQTVPDNTAADKILRSQRTLVGLYRYTDNAMVLGNALPVTYSGAVTWVPEVIGEPCPDMVFANENDHAYVNLELDPVSRTTLSEHINDFGSATTRLMLWESLWSSVRDARMPLGDFVGFAFNNLPEERDDNVVRQVSGNLASAFNYYTSFGGQDQMRRLIQDFSLQQLDAAEPGSEIQKIWFDNFLGRAHTGDALDILLALLDGSRVIDGIDIDQDKRWTIVVAMNRFQHGDYEALLAAESVNDPSDQGANFALGARVIRPIEAVKQEYLDAILNAPDTYKMASLRYIVGYLYPVEQQTFQDANAERILAALPGLNDSADERFLNTFAGLIPATCSQDNVARLTAASDAFTDFHPVIIRTILVNLQEDQRCLNIRALLDL